MDCSEHKTNKAGTMADDIFDAMMSVCKKYMMEPNKIESTARFYATKFSEIAARTEAESERKVWAKASDGTVHFGKADEFMIRDIHTMLEASGSKYTNKNIERILLKCDKTYAFCKDTKQFYTCIEPDVGRYIMEHKCSDFIFDVLAGKFIMMPVKGIQHVAMKKFIASERNLVKKARVLIDIDDFDEEDENYKVTVFNAVWYENNYRDKIDDIFYSYQREEFERRCEDEGLEFTDVVTRLIDKLLAQNKVISHATPKHNAIEEAIQESKEDKLKYNYENTKNWTNADYRAVYNGEYTSLRVHKTNYNLYLCIKYLIKHDNRENV